MKVLAISGRYRHAAAAVAVDGRVVAAVSEDALTRVAGQGYTGPAGFPARAVAACLEASGIEAGQLDRASVVADGGNGHHAGRARATSAWFQALSGRAEAEHPVAAAHADALQAAASGPAGAILIASAEPPVIATFVRDGAGLSARDEHDAGPLLRAARWLQEETGAAGADPVQALDRLSVGGDPHLAADLTDVIRWTDRGVAVDRERLAALVTRAAGATAGRLADASTLNVPAQRTRRALAASFLVRLAAVIGEGADRLRAATHATDVAFGGSLFASSRLTTELRQVLGDAMSVAAVPEPAGRALGAALADAEMGDAAWPGLALGPAFSEDAIKRTLDNCRLEYLYEPDWARLLRRASRLLAQGKVVAWFQGSLGFGPRATGSRSILCDPSGRYARANVNEYLRQVPADEPLPLVLAPSHAGACLARPAPRPFAVIDAEVRTDWRDRLGGALDWRQYVRLHDARLASTPALCDLLEHHLAETGVPGLIETNLCGPGEPPACTPRDAIRTVYSSAIDALVIGRFLLMKDHWLLRSDGE